VGGKVEALVAAVARRYGLSHAALNALAVIEGAEGPVPTGEVSVRMHITTGTMTTVLDTLERNGYVQRLADPDDRRRVLVEITPAAQSLLDQLLPAVQQVAKAVMGVLDDGALLGLLDTLATIGASVDSVPEDLPAPAPRRTPGKLRRAGPHDRA
jgi:DNA-binding MarR family transcriptional regulator